jgi:hypothetical protein
MAGVRMGSSPLGGAGRDIPRGPGGAGRLLGGSAGAGISPPGTPERLAQVGRQGRPGDTQALRLRLVRTARPQEVGTPQPGGTRGCAGTPVRPVSRGGLEVTGPNAASKPPRIDFKARRER